MTAIAETQAGYTLVEVLAALTILGLTLTGMAAGVGMVGRLERHAAEAAREERSLAALRNTLERLLGDSGPFASSEGLLLSGDAAGFQFDCQSERPCAAVLQAGRTGMVLAVQDHGQVHRLAVPHSDAATDAFQYRGTKTLGSHWPPDNPTDYQRLAELRLVQRRLPQSPQILASVKLWLEAEPARLKTAAIP